MEDQPSLLICCSRFSNNNTKTGSIAKWVLAERHPASREVLLKKLTPQLKPKPIVDLIGTGLRLRRAWCYSGSTATAQLRRLEEWEKDKDPNKNPFTHVNIRFTDAIRKASDAGCRTTYIMMHGSDGWSSDMGEWTKLTVMLPQVRFVLIFALMPRNMGFDRTGWSTVVDGQV